MSNPAIALVSFHPSFAGGEQYVKLIVPQLVRRGYRVSFCGQWLAQYEDCQFSAVCHSSQNFLAKWSIPDVDVLILNGLRPLYKYVLNYGAFRKVRTKVIYVHHLTLDDSHRGTIIARLRTRLVPLLLRLVDHVVVVSEGNDTFLLRHRHVSVITNGVNVKNYIPKTHQHKPELVVVCVGTLSVRKNQALLIRSVNGLRQIRLVLLGDGPELNNLIQLVTDLGMQQQVNFVGHVDDPALYYQMADVAVMPSLQEAFGLVAVEAMASGLPVITTPTVGGREIVDNGVTGIVLNDFSETALRSALVDLTDCIRRTAMGREGRRRAEALFDIERVGDQWHSLLAAVAK